MKQREPDSVKALLHDALQSAESILTVTTGMTLADYERDEIRRWAAERQFTIVGEALGSAWKIDRALDRQISALRQIVNFRNQLVHGYGEIEHHTVWGIITHDVPRLTSEIRTLLAALPDGETPA